MSNRHPIWIDIFHRDNPLGRAIGSCEIHCDEMCCGVEAFEMTQTQMNKWLEKATEDEIARAKEQAMIIIKAIDESDKDVKLMDGLKNNEESADWIRRVLSFLHKK